MHSLVSVTFASMRSSKSSQLDREVAAALRGGRSRRRSHATKAGPADARQRFGEAYRALQHAFQLADEEVARAHNEAVRRGATPAMKTSMNKLKTVTNKTEKALRDYGETVDDLLGDLE